MVHAGGCGQELVMLLLKRKPPERRAIWWQEGWHCPPNRVSPRGAGSAPGRRVSRKLWRSRAARKLLELIDCGREERGSVAVVMGTLKASSKQLQKAAELCTRRARAGAGPGAGSSAAACRRARARSTPLLPTRRLPGRAGTRGEGQVGASTFSLKRGRRQAAAAGSVWI